MKNKSFTLIEILVVIIIVGLLAGLIIGATASSIEEAKKTKSFAFSSDTKKELMLNILQEWKFDEGSGTMTYDINKSSNSGALVGFLSTVKGGGDNGASGWLSSKNCVSGTCLNFDGVNNSYVNNTDTGALPLFTLTTWVYNVSGGQTRHSILSHFWEVVNQNICFFSYSFADDYWRETTNSKVAYNKWSYVVTVWNGSYISHYVNGELAYKDPLTSSGTSENLFNIAGYSGRIMKGRLDEMIIYNKNLSTSEIKQNYLAGLNSLLAKGGIDEEEYNQRIEKLAEK